MRRHTLCMLLAVCAALGTIAGAIAGGYPDKPIRFIVPFAPGGATDILARLIGQKLTEMTGQPVVVDDRPGAGGSIGADLAAHATPDGYTIFLGSAAPLAVAPKLYKHLPYNVQRDFAPITLISKVPDVLVVNPSVPVNSVTALIAYAKAHPHELTFASSGNGGSAHLAGEMLNTMAGIRMTHVPYKGTAPALAALLSGEVKVAFPDIIAALPVIKAGKVRPLAVTTTERAAVLPQVPTIAETVPGYVTGPWYGVLASAGTPPRILAWLHDRVVAILDAREVRGRLIRSGSDPIGSTPAAFAAFIKADTERVGKVIAQAHIHVQ